ncbi:unnamed protein product [Cutaneotrichosporon oleaginosum]
MTQDSPPAPAGQTLPPRLYDRPRLPFAQRKPGPAEQPQPHAQAQAQAQAQAHSPAPQAPASPRSPCKAAPTSCVPIKHAENGPVLCRCCQRVLYF